MRPKHILHVFYSFRVGGSELRTCQIINGLGEGYRHTVVALDGDFSAQSLILKKDDVVLVHPPGFLQRSFFSNAFESRKWVGRLKPDLMIAYSWGGFEWLVGNSMIKRCPDISAIEGFGTDEAHAEKPHRQFLRRMFSNRCTALMACSLNLKNVALESWRAHPEKVVYIPNGVDLAKYVPRSWDARSPRIVLGIVASLSSVKNHVLLLDAFRRLPAGAAELQIVGDGLEREHLLAHIADWGLSQWVRLFGHQADPSEIERQFDVFCLSSKSEQMPIALLEAMASALPVVGTDVGDVRRMVCQDNRRFVVPPDNVDLYAAALKELVADGQLRASLGKQNRKRCEQEFGFSLMLQRHRQLYDRCIQERPAGVG